MSLTTRLFDLVESAVPTEPARRLVHRLVDRWYGFETAGDVPLKDLGLSDEERTKYVPSSWFTLPRIARIITFQPDDVFVDFGSGKGRVVLMAARYYAFKRVIGVEIAGQLNDVARANVDRNLERLRCKRVELVTSDATCYVPPEDMTVAYFYTPFYGSVFSTVVENIRKSWLTRVNRRLWVVLQHPPYASNAARYATNSAVLASSPWLEHKGAAATSRNVIDVYRAAV